jgi:hypothetical protein
MYQSRLCLWKSRRGFEEGSCQCRKIGRSVSTLLRVILDMCVEELETKISSLCKNTLQGRLGAGLKTCEEALHLGYPWPWDELPDLATKFRDQV